MMVVQTIQIQQQLMTFERIQSLVKAPSNHPPQQDEPVGLDSGNASSPNTATENVVVPLPWAAPNETAPYFSKEEKKSMDGAFYKPRLLVGIFSDVRTENAKEIRDRIRQKFRMWNDNRLCSFSEFVKRSPQDDIIQDGPNDVLYDCQVVYTFVLGAYDADATSPHFADHVAGVPITRMMSTVRLYDTPDKPLVLHQVPQSSQTAISGDEVAPYRDIYEHNDGIFLNIIENMNHGKTPTYLYWANTVSEQMNIPYVAKCDSDTVLILPKLFQFLHQELPKVPAGEDALPPSIISGAMRHKSGGFFKTTDESFWKEQYYQGMHLYLNGGMYIMSNHLAAVATTEARLLEHVIPGMEPAAKGKQENKEAHSYLEGHEDHDAIAMIEQGLSKSSKYRHSMLQFLIVPSDKRFYIHGMKAIPGWDHYLKKESKRRKNGFYQDFYPPKNQNLLPIDEGKGANSWKRSEMNKTSTLLVLFNATTQSMQKQYVEEMKQQGYHICNALQQLEHPHGYCDMHYFFVTAKQANHLSLNETTNSFSLASINGTKNNGETHGDVLTFETKTNQQLEVGLNTLQYIQKHLNFDAVIFSQAHAVNISQWNKGVLATAQYSLGPLQNQYLVIGDVRDKTRYVKPEWREFPHYCGSTSKYFARQHDGMQLYLGNDCFAFSANMIPLWLNEAEKHTDLEGECLVGSLGHDLTYLSYLSTETAVHWMALTQPTHFWS
jgi:hypothetical protein